MRKSDRARADWSVRLRFDGNSFILRIFVCRATGPTRLVALHFEVQIACCLPRQLVCSDSIVNLERTDIRLGAHRNGERFDNLQTPLLNLARSESDGFIVIGDTWPFPRIRTIELWVPDVVLCVLVITLKGFPRPDGGGAKGRRGYWAASRQSAWGMKRRCWAGMRGAVIGCGSLWKRSRW